MAREASKRSSARLVLRVLAGGFLAWVLVNVLWIGAFVYLESQHVTYTDYDLALLIYTTLIIAWPIGGLWAWMSRR
jgi:hypothetical protein